MAIWWDRLPFRFDSYYLPVTPRPSFFPQTEKKIPAPKTCLTCLRSGNRPGFQEVFSPPLLYLRLKVPPLFLLLVHPSATDIAVTVAAPSRDFLIGAGLPSPALLRFFQVTFFQELSFFLCSSGSAGASHPLRRLPPLSFSIQSRSSAVLGALCFSGTPYSPQWRSSGPRLWFTFPSFSLFRWVVFSFPPSSFPPAYTVAL